MGAQLVARRPNACGSGESVDAHRLELTDHGRTVEGDGRSDPGDHRVYVDLLTPVKDGAGSPLQPHGAAQEVDHRDRMPSFLRGFAQSRRGVERRLPGEDADSHELRLARYDRPESTRTRVRSAWRPRSMRKPISSRRVRVSSIDQDRSPRPSVVSITGRSSR